MATLPILPQLDLGINQANFTLPAGLKRWQARQREIERRRKAAERRAQWAQENPNLRLELHLSAVAELHALVEAESVDCVITDPPYEKAALPLHVDLANFAAYALKPGGQLVVMTGNLYAHEIETMLRANPHLEYRCRMAWAFGGDTSKMFVSNSWQRHKPILVYRKLPRDKEREPWLHDLIYNPTMGDAGKHHHWGQQLDGFQRIVDCVARTGYLICDPFLGGGTTALCALNLGCGFIGADVDADSIATSQQRISDWRNENPQAC